MDNNCVRIDYPNGATMWMDYEFWVKSNEWIAKNLWARQSYKLNINNMSEQRVLTNGEFKVGIGFNPGKHEAVEEIKRKAADLIDSIERLAKSHEGDIPTEFADTLSVEEAEVIMRRVKEVGRLTAIAVTNIETAAMYGVKAVTK